MISRPYGARISLPPRSIPPSLRSTKRNPLGICIRPVEDTINSLSRAIQDFLAVMAITLQCDARYSNPLRASLHFGVSRGCKLQKGERDLLEVLKFELEFLEAGGYGRSPRTPWRPQYIFEDSLTCMNYHSRQNPRPCGECVLMHLVPRELGSANLPCRHIPLNAAGETLDSLYRYSNQCETEETFGEWLRATIQRLEEERLAVERDRNKHRSPSRETIKGSPLYQSLHPKCANPACPTAFHWTAGGKFFRFRSAGASATLHESTSDSPGGIHGVRHFWLCERCSNIFALVHDNEYGVVLKALWPELPVAEAYKESSAA